MRLSTTVSEGPNEKIILRLRHFKDDYSDEIPETILHSTSSNPPPLYKVRKAWFQSLSSTFNQVKRAKITIDTTLTGKIRAFQAMIHDLAFKQRLTTKEDIDQANEIIDELIEALEI